MTNHKYKTKIIIDTDPGQDDAAAIMLALGSPELQILGITVVAGNVPLTLTTKNTRIICELAGRSDIKIFAGAEKPLTGKLVTAEHVHGITGLNGPELFEPSIQLKEGFAPDFLVETLRSESSKTVTICPIGPLTNIALALQKDPTIADRIDKIVLMGGGHFSQGNVTPAAEFNIFSDPEAAAIVFGCGCPIIMMPLDVTHKVLTTKVRIQKIQNIGNTASSALVQMLTSYHRYNTERHGKDGGPLHDPTTIAYLLKPTLFRGKMCNVEIETKSDLTKGATVVDWWGITNREKNVFFIHDVDVDGFFDLLTERVANLI
jgi:purine nucleosidase